MGKRQELEIVSKQKHHLPMEAATAAAHLQAPMLSSSQPYRPLDLANQLCRCISELQDEVAVLRDENMHMRRMLGQLSAGRAGTSSEMSGVTKSQVGTVN